MTSKTEVSVEVDAKKVVGNVQVESNRVSCGGIGYLRSEERESACPHINLVESRVSFR